MNDNSFLKRLEIRRRRDAVYFRELGFANAAFALQCRAALSSVGFTSLVSLVSLATSPSYWSVASVIAASGAISYLLSNAESAWKGYLVNADVSRLLGDEFSDQSPPKASRAAAWWRLATVIASIVSLALALTSIVLERVQ